MECAFYLSSTTGVLKAAVVQTGMNHLARAGAGRYVLPKHAHLVVYDGNDRELITVYDCGAAQKPPSAQLLGTIGRIECPHERTRTQTGYVLRLSEPGYLECQGPDDYRIVSRSGDAPPASTDR